jgi:peptide/nickel transport system permease protein
MQVVTNDSDSLRAEGMARSSPVSTLWRFFARNPLAFVGALLALTISLACLFAPLITPYDPIEIDIQQRFTPPSLGHPLGTDSFGRDVLARILYGGRNTLLIGLMVVALAFSVGVPAGIYAGYRGGKIDAVAMRIVDAMMAFPSLVLAIALAAVLGPSLRNAMLAVAITLIPQFARLARGQAVNVRSFAYMEAGRAIGLSESRLMLRYILPNSLAALLVQASLNLGSAILQTASLGFLGLGAQPPRPEWGADVAANTPYLREAPWVALFPGLAILLTVLAFNLIGDALVDWLNPRTRKGV